ncbi:MAG: YraN family protein [Candidatus Omnitrophica bacterium]|nr:YraN family protein [Candidatus Omnitrophota bacterium]
MTAEEQTTHIGGIAEQVAADYLRQRGYTVILQNYRCQIAEVDIIAKDGDVLCFVEVKMRTAGEQGHPLESITPRKQRKISLAALTYLQEQDLCDRQIVRFDVVAITLESEICDVQLVKGAFDSCF